jgi:hypothetical protein
VHVKRGANVHSWFSHAIDRMIRSAYICWSDQQADARKLGEGFDDGLGTKR